MAEPESNGAGAPDDALESLGTTESTRRLLLKGVLKVERSYQPDDVLTVIMQKCVADLDETMQRLWEKNRA